MNWVRERDLLIAQTMAFVQSVAGKKPEIEARPEARIQLTPVEATEAVERPVEIVAPVLRPAPEPRSEIREEILGRVAAFRAHQQLFEREREAYFNAVLAKARASTSNQPNRPGN
jgi:hypothetical protein